jgi:hypothetical protein
MARALMMAESRFYIKQADGASQGAVGEAAR